jgi:hypothetical protein
MVLVVQRRDRRASLVSGLLFIPREEAGAIPGQGRQAYPALRNCTTLPPTSVDVAGGALQ